MQVILQEKIRNLGGIGDIVQVKPGYARNFLLRQGKAMIASKSNIDAVLAKRSELEKLEKARIQEAKLKVAAIEALGEITMDVHTNEEGKLFGSIGAAEIVDWLHAKGQDVHKSEVSIVESPLRFIGTYTAQVECYAEVIAKLKLTLTSENVKPEVTEEAKPDEASEESEDSTTQDQAEAE